MTTDAAQITLEEDTKQLSPMEEVEEKPINVFLDTEFVTLRNPGKFEFKISKKDAWISQLIRESLQADATFVLIDLLSIQYFDEMKFVIDYMQYHNGQEPEIILKPLRSYIMKEVCFSTPKCPKDEPWDAKFIDSKTELQLAKLSGIANFLDIKSLLHLVAAKIASIVERAEEEVEDFDKRVSTMELPIDSATKTEEGKKRRYNQQK